MGAHVFPHHNLTPPTGGVNYRKGKAQVLSRVRASVVPILSHWEGSPVET